MQRTDDGYRGSLIDSIKKKGHLRIVEHDTSQRLGHRFVFNSVNFDLPPDGLRSQNLSRLLFDPVASSIFFIGIVEDQGSIKPRLSLSTLAADPIAAFRSGAVSLVSLFANTIKPETDGIG